MLCQAEPGAEHRPGCDGTADGWTPDVNGGAELVEAPELHPVPMSASARRVWDVAIGATPSPWSAPQPELAALVRYAQEGQWCDDDARGWRIAGRVYCYAVAIPVSLACYLLAWVAQRPARLAAAGLLGVVLAVWL